MKHLLTTQIIKRVFQHPRQAKFLRHFCSAPDKAESMKGVTLTPCKGTADFRARQLIIRSRILSTAVDCFKRHGAVCIETPIMERKDLLIKNHSEVEKNIFNVIGGDECDISLRYDLTVPFARFMAANDLDSLKCYRVGKVFRRDHPSVTTGRYREFYQCDFDIAEECDAMIADVECLQIMNEILSALEMDQFKYKIKLNHRHVLYGLFDVCGIPSSKHLKVCHTIDKLDKKSWDEVREDLICELNLSTSAADKLGSYIQLKGQRSLVDELLNATDLKTQDLLQAGLRAVALLLDYSKHYDLESVVSFDLSLARGLDYYTGIMFEAVPTEFPDTLSEEMRRVGSLAAGGRYDHLIGLFHPNGKQVPCVGLSIGVDRIFALLNDLAFSELPKTVETEVYVASPQKHFEEERMKLCRMLWDADIKAEMSYKKNDKFLNQVQHCEQENITFIVIIAQSELKNRTVKIRNVQTRKEIEVPRNMMVSEIKKLLRDHSNESS